MDAIRARFLASEVKRYAEIMQHDYASTPRFRSWPEEQQDAHREKFEAMSVELAEGVLALLEARGK